jgi:hypothetical protein
MKPTSLSFNKEKFTLLLNIDKEEFINTSLKNKASNEGFVEKDSFHITIIGFSKGREILNAIKNKSSDDEVLIIQKIERKNQEFDWTFTPTENFFHIEKDYTFNSRVDHGEKITEHRESYIQEVRMLQLTEFYTFIHKLTGVSFEEPFPHITLYIKSDQPDQKEGISINSLKEFQSLNQKCLVESVSRKINKIIIPVRAQVDTITAIFILKKFGQTKFTTISDATIEIWQLLPEDKTVDDLEKEGVLVIDVGGGKFDHHNKESKTTATRLIADYLKVLDYPPLKKLIELAERDDIYGKGTISDDPLDKAFGLSGLVASLNKNHSKDPEKVVGFILPLIEAHYAEEVRRTEELPQEFKEKLEQGRVELFEVKQRDKKLKVVIIESSNPSIPGFLRSVIGGRFDVVAQILSSGHINILTRPTKRVDLRSLTALIRLREAEFLNLKLNMNMRGLSVTGRIKELPDWYYDTATNSIQNGGINPKEVKSSKITRPILKKILELGLSESLWNPMTR